METAKKYGFLEQTMFLVANVNSCVLEAYLVFSHGVDYDNVATDSIATSSVGGDER
ncbi:hypothetical protein ACMD2_04029 [Ananas comosus]|uniref:Uncharacterized protein n=1 Tax=Ananas comosus TaxID=4615 RepID=A0A199W8C4_ANACO|nr:hypothetical protein ACMD2_04029 [Ananas comosus]